MRKFGIALTTVLSLIFIEANAVSTVYPIRIYRSTASGKYLVVLSARMDWIDRIDDKAGYESTYQTNAVRLLWGDFNQMKPYSLNTKVGLNRAGEGAGWVVKAHYIDGKDRMIFSLPSRGVKNENAFVRFATSWTIQWTEELVEVDDNDRVYQTFHQAAQLGMLPMFLSGRINSDAQVQQCNQLLDTTPTDAFGNKLKIERIPVQ